MMMITALFFLLAGSTCTSITAAYEVGCIYPSAMPDPIQAQDEMINFVALSREVGKIETPIAVHNGLVSGLCGSVCLAYHDPNALHPLTKSRPSLPVPEFGHNAWSIAMCNLQCHTVAVGLETMAPLLQRWNVNITERWHPEYAKYETLGRDPTTQDMLAVAKVAIDNDYHPFLIGQISIMDIFANYLEHDGWNRLGKYSFDTQTGERVPCTSNCMPYSDTSGYFPRNHPGKPITQDNKYNVTGEDMYWQPLLEDDGHGYFTRQQHVVPHLATHAKTFIPNLRNKTLDPPNYNYYQEAVQVVEELRLTASNETRQRMIEFFDNKFFVRQLIQHSVHKQFRDQHSYQKHLLYSIGLAFAYDDAVVLAWTEKIRHDLVRPTTVIQRWGSDKLVTYGGGGGPSSNSNNEMGQATEMIARNFKATEIEARNFEAYIRVMPHAEYPSGSSCICTVFQEFTDGFTQPMYGDTTKNIVFGAAENGHKINCDGSIGKDLPNGGCDHSFSFTDMKELEQVCGVSRLWGGMHFSKSVPGGHELCSGISGVTLDFVKEIMADTDFGGKEYFYGDERPMCSDPSKDMSGGTSKDVSGGTTNTSAASSWGLAGVVSVVTPLLWWALVE